jgi:hypothetical protein
MAASLAIKPQDAGLVWLYFLLSRGEYRKRTLQTLAVTIVFDLAGILWVGQVVSHWMQGLHSSLPVASVRGNSSDPGPAQVHGPDPGSAVNLQTVVSVF